MLIKEIRRCHFPSQLANSCKKWKWPSAGKDTAVTHTLSRVYACSGKLLGNLDPGAKSVHSLWRDATEGIYSKKQ